MEDTSSSVGREKKIGVFVSKQMIPIVLLIVFIASVDGSYENMSTENPSKASNEVVIVQDAFIVEWQVNHTSQTIQFDASVAIDEKGWFLLGFMSPNNNSANITTKLTTIADTNGDVVLNWPVSASKRRTLDCNTMNITGNLTQDNHQDYRVEKLPSYNNSSSNVSSFRITRKLDTSDPSDVPFTNASLWIFGAYGTSNTSFAQLEEFVQVIGNTLQFTEVKLMEKKPDAEDKNPQDHYMFIEEVKKHWMTVIMAVAAVVSLVIVGVVYCCFRKGGIKKKKTLSKTFYREVADEDDEARVAFLHSRT